MKQVVICAMISGKLCEIARFEVGEQFRIEDFRAEISVFNRSETVEVKLLWSEVEANG